MIKYTKQELNAIESISKKVEQNCTFRECHNCPFEYQGLCSRGVLEKLQYDMKQNLEE